MGIEAEAVTGRTRSRMSARREVAEVVTRGEGPPAGSMEQKRQIAAEGMQSVAALTEVARRWASSLPLRSQMVAPLRRG
jgi:hypothetical protein